MSFFEDVFIDIGIFSHRIKPSGLEFLSRFIYHRNTDILEFCSGLHDRLAVFAFIHYSMRVTVKNKIYTFSIFIEVV